MSKDTRPVMVSIRCTTYNHEKYIRDALEGFVMQKTNFRFEAIVHDDASTDGTADIIREYAEKYPEIIKPIYETENQYSKHDGSLRRIMDEACKGKYIALCEGDDYWIDPLKLQKQVNFLEMHPNFSLCGSNGLIIWENYEQQPKYFNTDITISKELQPNEIIGTWAMPTASLIYRKEVLYDYPNWTNKIYSGDQTLILISLYKGGLFFFRDITCIYRKSSTNQFSISNNADSDLRYVWNQLILLYDLYDDWTKGKYKKLCKDVKTMYQKKIIEKNKQIKYDELKKHSILSAFIHMPKYTLRLIWYKTINKIK